MSLSLSNFSIYLSNFIDKTNKLNDIILLLFIFVVILFIINFVVVSEFLLIKKLLIILINKINYILQAKGW